MWVAAIFMLQKHQDQLNMPWPFGAKVCSIPDFFISRPNVAYNKDLFRLRTYPGAQGLVKRGTLWPSRCTTCSSSPSGHSSWSPSSWSLAFRVSGWSNTGWWPSATLWRPQTRPSMRRRSGSRISNSLIKSRALILLSQGADGRR